MKLSILLIAYAAVATGPCCSAEEKFWLDDGLKALETNKFKEAIVPLTKAIKQSSLSTSANYHNCVIAISKARTVEAFLTLKGRNQYVLHAYTDRGIAYSNLGDDKKAIEDFNSGLRAFTLSAKATCNRGRSYMRLKMIPEALKDFDTAIKIAPTLAEAYANRAIIYRMLRQTAKENADLKQVAAIRKDPDHAYVEQAFQRDCLVDEALKVNPKNAVLLTERGMVLASNNKLSKGIEYLKKAIQADPKFYEAYGCLSDCYMAQENYDDALATAKQLEKMKSNDRTTLIRIGLIYYNSGRHKEGAPYMKRILKLPAKTSEDYRFRTLCHMALDNPRAALKENEQAIKMEPRSPRYWDDRAMCLNDLKRYSEAIQAETRAICFKPTWSTAYVHRAQIYAKLHNLDEADDDLDRAQQLSPNDKEIFRIKGAVEALKGNLELSFADGQTGRDPFNRSTKAVNRDALDKEIARYTKIITTIPSQPAPFYDRAVLNIATDNLSPGITDLNTFLKLSKWHGRSSSYAACLLALTLRESGKFEESRTVLKTAAQRLTAANSVPILEFLTGKTNEKALLAKAKTTNTETRDRLFLGIHLLQEKRIADAQAQLDWVQNKGDQNIDEYVLVSIYLQKAALIPKKEHRQFDSR